MSNFQNVEHLFIIIVIHVLPLLGIVLNLLWSNVEDMYSLNHPQHICILIAREIQYTMHFENLKVTNHYSFTRVSSLYLNQPLTLHDNIIRLGFD